MLFRIRTNLDLYYRLFFLGLFLLMGISGLGVVLLENYAGLSIIPIEYEVEKKALHATLTAMGLFGTCTASLMIYFMREKRRADAERRRRSTPVNFTDQRVNIDDRRSALH